MAKTKSTLKERMLKKKEELKARGSKGDIIYLKEGTLRVRPLPVGDENDFVVEVTQFYLGAEIKGVYSPSTFGLPCAIMEKYNELKESSDPDDKELAKKFVPKKKYLMPVVVFADEKGKQIDKEKSGRMVQLTNGLYQEIIDLYLDEDEWGDMTDTEEGYDLKLTRTGTGMTDTEYAVKPCKNSSLDKEFRKEINLDELAKSLLPTYEESKEKINSFLNLDDDDEDEKPKKKKKKKSKKSDI